MATRKKSLSVNVLDATARARRDADLQLSMSERLVRVHELSKQLTAIRGRARRP